MVFVLELLTDGTMIDCGRFARRPFILAAVEIKIISITKRK